MINKNSGYLEKMDRKTLTVVSLDSKDTDRAFWLSKPPIDRLIALELLRQRFYNYESATGRLQRVFEVAEQA